MSAPTVWQYRLRTPKGAWLADVILRSDGFFATVSDWGNYAFRWTHPGMPFREFVVSIGGRDDTSYVCGKLGREDTWDGAATLKAIREYICTARREGAWTKERAAKEWEVLADALDSSGLHGAHDFDEMDEGQFARWYSDTGIGDAAELARYDYDSDLLGFCREVMPALAAAIRAELAAEQQAQAAQAGGAQS